MSKQTIKISDLRHRIKFQKEKKTADDYHGHTSTWNDVAVVWAKVEPVSGREYYYAHQLKNAISHKITVRYRDDITVEMRVVFEERIMKIESLINLQERERFIELRCMEEKNA